MQSINVLEKTSLRHLNEGYLKVYNTRKEELIQFVKDVVLEKNMKCSLLNPWGNPVLTDQEINDITTYIKSLGSELDTSLTEDCPCKYLQIVQIMSSNNPRPLTLSYILDCWIM